MTDSAPDATAAVTAVTRANQAFYDAHEARDYSALAALCEQSPRASCTHPGWPMLRGWEAVSQSWRAILDGPGRTQFILTDLEVHIEGAAAWVTCNENLLGAGEASAVAAVNLFVHSPNGWLLVGHHASPILR